MQRPTALSLAKTAKDAKDNEVIKEDRLETSPSKPGWMKEVEERKKKPRASPQRRHKTLPARSSELDSLFEQRKQVQPNEAFDPASLEGTSDGSRPAAEDIDPELQKMFERRKNLAPLDVEGDGEEPERPKSFHGDHIDPELNKMFEKRKKLTPLEGDGGVQDAERPKSFHANQIDPELSKMFEKRKNLKPLEVDGDSSGEGVIAKEIERPKSLHGDEMDAELNKMFERRKNLKPVEGRATNRDNEDEPVFKPRNVHLQSSQATELGKMFEKRKQLRPVEGVRSHTPEGTYDDSSAVGNNSADRRQTSGIVRARFHDTKLEPLSAGRVEMKVASDSEVRTARQVQESGRMISPETSGAQVGRGMIPASVGQLPGGGQSGHSKPPHPPTSGAQVAEFVFDGRGASHATVGRIPGNQRGNLNTIGQQQHTSPEERHAGQETSGAQVAQFVFDGSAAASHATVARIPVGGNQRPAQGGQTQDSRKTSPSKVDSSSGTRENHVSDDHVIVARGHVIDSRDSHTKQAVISPTSLKSDTQGFLEQLSRKPVSGSTQAQGKFVSRDIPPERRHTSLSVGQGKRQADKEYLPPHRPHHGDLQPHPHGYNMPHVQPSPPDDFPPRNLPPINSQYSPSPPSQNSNLRSLSHSLSYPPNSQFSDHPPLKTKTSEPQFSHTPRSPQVPKEARVTSPRAVRVREVKSLVRGGDSQLREGNERRTNSYANVEDTRRSVGKTARETEFVRNRNVGNHSELERSSNGERHDVKQDRSVRLRNGEVSNNVNRNSDSLISYGPHGKETESRMRGRSPKRSDHQKTRRVQSADRSNPEIPNRVRSPERYDSGGNENSNRLSDLKVSRVQSSDTSGYEKMKRLRSPERTYIQETKGDRTTDIERRVKSPERSDGQRITRFDNLDNANSQGIKGLERPDKFDDLRFSRIRSPERVHDQRISRVCSPDRSGDHNDGKVQHPERSNGERISKTVNPGRSDAYRVQDDRALREKARDLNESSSNYPVGHDIVNKRNSDNGRKIDSKQNKTTSDAIPDGIQNDKNFENRTRGMKSPPSLGQRNDILNRESVERPKAVTVTVVSLSESRAYVNSPVIGRERSHDRGMTYGECNGIVNGDIGRRGVRTVRATHGKL